ncbi:MAG TPA: hypothetical protein VGI97_04820, partial [Gemmatimonadaceae bacterium]
MSLEERSHALTVARTPRLRFAPRRRLALAVAVSALLWMIPGGTGVTASEGALLLIGIITAADVALLPPRRALALTRATPETVGIGDSVEGRYTLASHWLRAVTVQLQDRFSLVISGGAGTTTVALAPFASSELVFHVKGATRGRAPLGAVGVVAHTRIGFVSARFLFGGDDSLLVVPSLSGVRRFRLLAMQHRLDTAGVRALRRRGEGLSFANLREYAI